ncbi:uncharacterized protein BXZ73DRAFT_37458 [Epithele typhae]|uniref:uncharacterized protein n=1 Tax=Epithele typhae TaxID=378194 RepID=UPI002008A6FC|nr:uncharacterized protein BXZ73DRAFT_37458 [Epithele typhae]KAH9946160.1 hypothetical protein BXZ73DRAFT_37458 [Epithele typhae]
MDVIAPPPPQSASPGLVQDFASHAALYGIDPRIATLDAIDPSHPLLSSPSSNSASTGASHASSPALTGVAPSFTTGSSFFAFPTYEYGTTFSTPGSAASSGNLTAGGSDLGFPSAGGGPPTTGHESGFDFPPPGFDNSASSSTEDTPGGAHLMVLGDLLKNIARTANSGSDACSLGQSSDAREIVTVLKKNVLLVAELVAAMQLGDDETVGNSPPHQTGTTSSSASASAAPTAIGEYQQPPLTLGGLPPGGSLDLSTMSDGSDTSRKRCASSMAGDRVVKSMKLEPQDDTPPLQISPTTTVPSTMMSQGHFAYSYPASMSSITDISAVPSMMSTSSMSSSRPPSSAGIPPPLALGMMHDANHSTSSLHAGLVGESVSSLPHSPDYLPASGATSASIAPSPGFIPGPGWSDGRVSTPRQPYHSLSPGLVLNDMLAVTNGMSVAGSSTSFTGSMYSPTRSTHLAQAPMNAASATIVRASRSQSLSYPFAHTAESISHPTMYESTSQSRPSTSGHHSPRGSSPEENDEGSDDDGEGQGNQYASVGYLRGDGAESISSADGLNGMRHAGQRRMSRTSPSNEGASSSSHGNEVPQEYRADVERIFFEFLTSICSNLDATDSKGEPIHQTLMAKKMQRLDESPDFRPFKFRIQAFTNAFLEELARQGFPEEKIPMKKASARAIRNFLWNQPYISRFNEEGKKSKSKGNHIWHVDAKRSDGGWLFRPFRRKLAGTPPGVAYVGLRWTWTPRIWDPQASRANMPVNYSSPALPPWLSWKEESLTGIPPPDAQSCDVTVEARFIQDGKEELLTHTVHITIAPMAAVDSTFTPSRRPSLVGDIHNPRRIFSDSIVSGVAQQPAVATQRMIRAGALAAAVSAPVVAPDSQVVQVLTTAAQRVAQEAQSQVVASPNEAGPELQALAKQQHVLTVTAQAISSKLAGEVPDNAVAQSNALTVAAQQVVLQAARQVVADRTVAAVSSGLPSAVGANTMPQVTVKEVSVATQSAVAQAVDMVGPLSSEVDVLMTAKSLLQQQTRAPNVPVHPGVGSMDPSRPHSTGTTPPYDMSIPAVPVPVSVAPSLVSRGGVYFTS